MPRHVKCSPCIRNRFRTVIAFSVLFCSISLTLVSSNLVFALDAMVLNHRRKDGSLANETDTCSSGDSDWKSKTDENSTEEIDDSIAPRMDWSTEVQGNLLSLIFIGSILGQFSSVWLYEIVHIRILLTGGLIMSGILNATLPFLVTRTSPAIIIVTRIFTGFYTGIAGAGVSFIPSIWFPNNERGRVTAFLFLGSSFARILFAFSGLIMSSLGWPAIFYLTGGSAILAALIFFIVFEDEPSTHVWVSIEEAAVIEGKDKQHQYNEQYGKVKEQVFQDHTDDIAPEEPEVNKAQKRLKKFNKNLKIFAGRIKVTIKEEREDIPLKKIILSRPFWANVIGHVSTKYLHEGSVTYTIFYLSKIHGYNMKYISLIVSLPTNISMVVFGLAAGFVNDYCVKKGVPLGTVRRTAGCVILLGTTMFFTIPFLSCEQVEDSIIGLLTTTSFRAAMYASVIASYADISPTFVKPITSLGFTLSVLGGLIVPEVMGLVGKDSKSQWLIIWLVGGAAITVTMLIYIIFLDTKIQKWDPKYKAPKKDDVREDETDEETNIREHDPFVMHEITPFDLFHSRYKARGQHVCAKCNDSAKLSAENESGSVLSVPGVTYFLHLYEDIDRRRTFTTKRKV